MKAEKKAKKEKKDKRYEYQLTGLWDWRHHKLADEGWEPVDYVESPDHAAAIFKIRRLKSRQPQPPQEPSVPQALTPDVPPKS